GGIAAMLTAINKIIPRQYKIKIALGVDEENISEGATILNQSDFLNDVVMVLVTETGMSDRINHQLVQQVFGRRGRASYDITVLGKSAHGSTPNQGKNAIEGAARLILDLKKIKQVKNKFLGSSSFFVRDISCQAGSLSIPEQTNLRLDWHIVPPQTRQLCLDQLKLFLKQWGQLNDFKTKVRLTPRKTAYLNPYIMDQNNYWNNLATKCINQVLGKNVTPIYGKSVADENIFGQKFPVLVIGPVGGNIHAGNEWVAVDSLLMLEKILIKFFKQVFE
ncbi:MAG: M20 family metallopeptidase, partial [Patescibacteria group bacterium]|nr:M20 family metallopeptidase [Patescibacteria group bacterium]